MNKFISDMNEFVDKYDLRGMAAEIGYKKAMLKRIEHMREELDELEEAITKKDDVKVIDAIIDITYLSIGTGVMFDFDFEKHWGAVHECNMNKVRVTDNSHKFGIKKPEGWIGPEKTHRKIITKKD